LRHVAFEQGRAVHHRHACNTDVILDRDLLAAQQPFAAGPDLRLPVPGTEWILRRRGSISRRARRHRRQRRRDKLVEPAIGCEGCLEGLLKSCDFIARQDETEISCEPINLLGSWEAHYHASASSLSLSRQMNKARRGRKGLEWHHFRSYRWSRRITWRSKFSGDH